VATTKRYKDAQQQWQEKTQWHNCVAYGAAVEYCLRIQTAAHILIEGELIRHFPQRATFPAPLRHEIQDFRGRRPVAESGARAGKGLL
jgi:hypothetical protein